MSLTAYEAWRLRRLAKKMIRTYSWNASVPDDLEFTAVHMNSTGPGPDVIVVTFKLERCG